MMEAKGLFRPSEYVRPASVEEASRLLAEHGEKARVLAGGTDLMSEKDPALEVLVDISGLDLDYIRSDEKGLHIGARATFSDMAVNPVLDACGHSVLAEAARQMGTPQIRNVATVGGNLCAAVPCADSAVPLLVLDASLKIAGPDGARMLPITDFFLDARKTALAQGELLTEIRVPAHPQPAGAAFARKGRVAVADLAVVNVAVRIALAEDGVCRDVRIALGAVAPTPMRATRAEEMLEGNKPEEELLVRVAEQASEEIRPISDVRATAAYRKELSRVLMERTLRKAIDRASS